MKMKNARKPDNNGETTHDAAMVLTLDQYTESTPIPTTAKPTMAPTI